MLESHPQKLIQNEFALTYLYNQPSGNISNVGPQTNSNNTNTIGPQTNSNTNITT